MMPKSLPKILALALLLPLAGHAATAMKDLQMTGAATVAGTLQSTGGGSIKADDIKAGSALETDLDGKVSLADSLYFARIGAGNTTIKPAAPRIILDTDMVEDAGDPYAVFALLSFMDRGDCEVLAIGTVLDYPTAAPAASALVRYFGYNIPVGKASGATTTNDNMGALLSSFPNAIPGSDGDNAEDTVALYRRVLAKQEDGSVTFVVIGQQTNMQALYVSAPDAYSPLTGAQLMTAKIAKIVIMGGAFPSGSEYNFYTAPASTAWLNTTTIPIVFSGDEVSAGTSAGSALVGLGNPARAVYGSGIGGGGSGNRPVWDWSAISYAVYGLSYEGVSLFGLSSSGQIAVNTTTGSDAFTVGSGAQRYLTKVGSTGDLNAAAQSAYSHTPLWVRDEETAVNLSPANLGFSVTGVGGSYPNDFYLGWGTRIVGGVRESRATGTPFSFGYEASQDTLTLFTHTGGVDTRRLQIDGAGRLIGSIAIKGPDNAQLALLAQGSDRYTGLYFRQSGDDATNKAGFYWDKVDQCFAINSVVGELRFLTNNVLKATLSTAGVLTVPGGLVGNASTATALNTARAINGVSFDGTADVNVPEYLTRTAGSTSFTAAVGVNTFFGSTAGQTVTLPAPTARGVIWFKNHSSVSVTVASASGSQIYTTSAQASLTVAAGDSLILFPDGNFWNQ